MASFQRPTFGHKGQERKHIAADKETAGCTGGLICISGLRHPTKSLPLAKVFLKVAMNASGTSTQSNIGLHRVDGQ